MEKIAILGAGMAGFSASCRLHTEGLKSVIYEKKPYHGGNSASFKDNGFIFDVGPHVSFTKNERIQKLFAESVNHEYEVVQVHANNYWKGHRIKHPAQCNLYGLPEDIVVDILSDFIGVQDKEFKEINNNYEEWLIASYGQTFAENFPMQYGLKFHTTTADNMSTDWVAPRMYRPEIKEVLHGALSPSTPDVHYVTHFRYPSQGGFVSYFDLFLDRADLRLNHELVSLDPKNLELCFKNGIMASYDYLVSSLPLPELIPMISGVPSDVLEASQRLACTTCILVNIGINREDISEAHWTYFYDQDIFFTRLSFPHMQSIHNVPPGTGSIQAEVYYSNKYRPLDQSPKECIEPVLVDLRRCGYIREDDKILNCHANIIPNANVIFDLDRAEALSTVHAYLDEIGILYCGRYGEWGYQWTDESFVSGENAAQKILDGISFMVTRV